MSDFYTEQLIKRQTGKKEIMLKILLVLALVSSILIALMFPFGFVVTIIVLVLVFVMFRRLDVEYEYLFVNGDLDIDVIIRKSKRKRVFSMDVSTLEILAPVDSIELKQYKKVKTYDYSSGSRTGRLYSLVVTKHGQKIQVIFEPNDTIVEGFFLLAPRKVVRN